MPRRSLPWIIGLSALLSAPSYARQDLTVCGTYPDKAREEIFLHQQAARHRPKFELERLAAAATARDIGNIALIEDEGDIVARRNDFNLDQRTVSFLPQSASAASYRFQTGAAGYDAAAANSGSPIADFLDDDTRQVTLPFLFPFYGTNYQTVFINSDGNLTFTVGDTATSERSLGRITAGPPRIAALFRDLDPSKSTQGVRVLSDSGRFVVSWVAVPEFSEFGVGPLQTFQVRLFPDGKVEVSFSGITTDEAILAISPGGSQGTTSLVTFLTGTSAEYTGTVAEVFRAGANEIDIVQASVKFYQTHEDAYDYLVIFNNMGIPASEGAVAFEVTLRNTAEGFGAGPVDIGSFFGSPSRLQSVMNMGPLSQYPANPNTRISGRGTITGDTPLTVLGHEAGHRFLAFVSVREPENPSALPMLGAQLAHWSFNFNSEASLLEGNRIRDNGAGAVPRFTTVATVEGYAPLDQYLMGFLAPEEVPPTFYVKGSNQVATRFPQVNVNISGERRDVAVEEIIRLEGRRRPDHTVAQRRFRFAFLLVAPRGTEPSQADLDKLETFRREFEISFQRYSSDRAVADATLKRSLKLSAYPAAGVIAGRSITATLSIAQPAESPIMVALETQGGGFATMPQGVTIPAGATEASFAITGLAAGVEEVIARPSDDRYETAFARIQVLGAPEALAIVVNSGDRQLATAGVPLAEPVVFQVVDVNKLPYPGLPVRASVTDGSVTPQVAVTDSQGMARFFWTPGPSAEHRLQAALEGASSVAATVLALNRPEFPAAGVVNAASFTTGLAPGAFASIFGTNLASGALAQATQLPLPQVLGGVSVTVNGLPARLHYVSDNQINLVVPQETPEGEAEIQVLVPAGGSAPVRVPVLAAAPGVFFDAPSGFGAILVSGSGEFTLIHPARRGDFIEIYATGLGVTQPSSRFPGLFETVFAPRVFLDGVELPVSFSGLAPGYEGLYQINAQVTDGAPLGDLPLAIEVNGRRSNEVKVRVQ